VIVFERRREGIIRVITGRDMDEAERNFYRRNKRGET
jgi:uncharacterized DUF497 family protein